MSEADEIIKEFIDESRGLLQQAEQGLAALEQGTTDPEVVRSIFRAFHTIKGSAGFLGYNKIFEVGLSAETVLGRVRNGSLATSSALLSALLAALRAIRTMLESVESAGHDGPQDPHELIAAIQHCA